MCTDKKDSEKNGSDRRKNESSKAGVSVSLLYSSSLLDENNVCVENCKLCYLPFCKCEKLRTDAVIF